jgi:hypothetical protein
MEWHDGAPLTPLQIVLQIRVFLATWSLSDTQNVHFPTN